MHFFKIQNTSKVQLFCKFELLHWKNHIKIYQTTTSFYLKKDLKLIQTDFFSEKMRNSGSCIYDNAHSLFGEDF